MNLIEKAYAQNFDFLSLNLYTGTSSWSGVLEVVVNWILILAGVIAFFYLVWSGFIYLTAGGNPDAAKKGQQGIINAIIGLVIIFLAFAIVRAVVSLLGTKTS